MESNLDEQFDELFATDIQLAKFEEEWMRDLEQQFKTITNE